MRILYLYCHPLPESFHAAILEEARAGLAEAGHDVDFCDLYAENFNPVIPVQERRDYHNTSRNQADIENHVARLRAAQVLVMQFPVWSFGLPAMLKGWTDKLLKPGVAFDISNPAKVKPLLRDLTRVVGVTTYGQPWWNALAIGDPPKRIVTRYMTRFSGGRTRAEYHALYHMNVASEAKRKAFMRQVRAGMAKL